MVLARLWRTSFNPFLKVATFTRGIARHRSWAQQADAGKSSSVSRQYHSVAARQGRNISFTRSDRLKVMSTYALVDLQEASVRQVIGLALQSALAVPQHPWSAEYVVESVLSELTAPSPSQNSSSGGDGSVVSSYSAVNATQPAQPVSGRGKGSRQPDAAAAAPAPTGPPQADSDSNSSSVRLLPQVAALLEGYTAACAEPSTGKGDGASAGTIRSSRKQSSASSRVPGSLDSTYAQVEQLQAMFGQLLYEEYQQVEEEDVAAFCSKLLSELSSLVEAAQQAADGEQQGLCALCGRDMPLTKHHLIPRDVHKDFKKRGCSFDQLQAGLMVCRPCHSAVHRAVPDNKQLALHYSTAEALSQHEEVAKFAAWAGRQRVTSKGDATSKHFKYRR